MKSSGIWWVMAFVLGLSACGKEEVRAAEPAVDSTRRLRIVVGDRVLTATLYDHPTAKDFASRLPLTTDLSDYAGMEKVFTPSPALTTQGSPSGLHPKAGDIALYVPWGNIAVFYRNGTASGSLIPIGRIEGNIGVLQVSGSLTGVKFELMEVEGKNR